MAEKSNFHGSTCNDHTNVPFCDKKRKKEQQTSKRRSAAIRKPRENNAKPL